MRRDPTGAELTEAERILLGYLHHHCRGAAWARTYARVREDLAAVGFEVGEREMYDLVGSLVLKRRPVATTPAGAFIYETARDVRIGLRHLVGRVIKQHRRIRAYKAAAREGLSRQAYLDLAEAERAYVAARDGRAVKAAAAQGLLFGALAPGSRT